ncbi:nucleotidyltransferase family protein [Streptomyces sp. NPDC088261]|uniref:nucleotidyltransferase family protein n=1 Tax=Streptomyces sp. NPDC088261 TaxID=3365851 RepID=UPI00381EA53A
MTDLPESDIEAEAVRLIDGLAERGCVARLIGGLAIAEHRHTAMPESLSRSYGDIDLVIPPHRTAPFRTAMEELGYTPNKRFNNLRGDKRMLFYDEPHDRQIDVFVGRFDMCHGVALADRLDTGDRTLFPSDLLLTKLQVVQINRKDLIDAVTLLLTHDVVDGSDGVDAIELGRLIRITSGDWGWYTTLTDNLDRIPDVARELLEPGLADLVAGRVLRLRDGLEAAPKSLKWKTRSKIGRRVSWYELPEEVGQTIVTR